MDAQCIEGGEWSLDVDLQAVTELPESPHVLEDVVLCSSGAPESPSTRLGDEGWGPRVGDKAGLSQWSPRADRDWIKDSRQAKSPVLERTYTVPEACSTHLMDATICQPLPVPIRAEIYPTSLLGSKGEPVLAVSQQRSLSEIEPQPRTSASIILRDTACSAGKLMMESTKLIAVPQLPVVTEATQEDRRHMKRCAVAKFPQCHKEVRGTDPSAQAAQDTVGQQHPLSAQSSSDAEWSSQHQSRVAQHLRHHQDQHHHQHQQQQDLSDLRQQQEQQLSASPCPIMGGVTVDPRQTSVHPGIPSSYIAASPPPCAIHCVTATLCEQPPTVVQPADEDKTRVPLSDLQRWVPPIVTFQQGAACGSSPTTALLPGTTSAQASGLRTPTSADTPSATTASPVLVAGAAVIERNKRDAQPLELAGTTKTLPGSDGLDGKAAVHRSEKRQKVAHSPNEDETGPQDSTAADEVALSVPAISDGDERGSCTQINKAHPPAAATPSVASPRAGRTTVLGPGPPHSDEKKSLSSPRRRNYPKPKPRQVWTEEEHEAFTDAMKCYGRKWSQVAQYVGTKTVEQTRSHAQKYFKRLKRTGEAGFVPPPVRPSRPT